MWQAVEAYPRARGGTTPSALGLSHVNGLSPRTRGNRDVGVVHAHKARPIPAHAGEPCVQRRHVGLIQAYPRARGGTIHTVGKRFSITGLSPRTRGNLAALYDARIHPGPIPAHAGEPGVSSVAVVWCGAYPRARGGTARPLRIRRHSRGLSPRTRGNRTRPLTPWDRTGPIPAHAGEPGRIGRHRARLGAYPRARGGTHQDWEDTTVRNGLSPRTRGNRG